MDISRANYESWFLDYLDGRLDAGQQEILRAFLEFNPDLKQELESMEPARLEAEDVRYEMKLALRKPSLNPDRRHLLEHFEDYCMLSIEKELSAQEEEMFMDIVGKDPRKQEVYKLYLLTLLKADKQIRYEKKSGLRKRFIQIPRIRLAIASAAAILLLLLSLPVIFRVTREPVTVSGIPEAVEKAGPEGGSPARHEESVSTAQNALGERNTETIANSAGEKELTASMEHFRERGLGKPESALHDKASGSLLPGRQNHHATPVPGESEGTRSEPTDLSFVASLGTESLVYPGGIRLSLKKETVPAGVGYLPLSGNDAAVAENAGPEINNRTRRKFSFWNLADAGLRKISEISNESYSIDREADKQGHTRWIKFESPVFGISTPMKSPESPGE